MKIQYKIVIPFSLLFIIATLLTALVSISLMARNLEARLTSQLENASQMISRADFAMNSSILRNLKTVIGADVITYRRDGSIVATTLASDAQRDSFRDVISADVLPPALEQGPAFVIRSVTIAGRPYRIGYRRLQSAPDTVTAVIADTSDITDTERAIARTLLLIAGLIVVLMSVVSHLLAKSVTAPVLRLVQFTRKVAAGEPNERADGTSGDEIGVLAHAFNEMMDQLRRSEEKLLQSEKLAVTGLIAARVAHEVRNPMSAIKMQAQLLRAKLKGTGGDMELIQAILQEIDRVEWVIRGMLDLPASQELQLEEQDILDVLDDVLNLMGPQLRHRKVVVQKSYGSGIPSMMLDRNRLKIAFLNLIMNASEAMPNGGTLEINACRDNETVLIKINDDGVGLDAAVEGRLFDPFVTTKPEGVGLGLVNTRNIVGRHHGTVELLPRDGRGVQAVLRLPIAPSPTGSPGSAADHKTGVQRSHG